MYIKFHIINDFPYLAIMDGLNIYKIDIVVDKKSLDVLYDYYVTILASFDDDKNISIYRESVQSIEKYAKEKLEG